MTQSNATLPSHQPLCGVVAVELGHSVAGPFAGQVLAELGARLIKAEKPGSGDDGRAWGPPDWHGASATFQSLNRNKHSVVVDYKNPDERRRFRDLILREADIVVQNLRPGLAEEYGLGASLVGEKPSLIYCNIGAFGAVGPLKDKPGYDPLLQAFGGLMSITGEPDRPPVRIGPSIIDIGTGMWAALGIIAALRRRDLTGEGCVVDSSLLETALAWMTVPIAMYLASGEAPGRHGSGAAIAVPYQAFKCKDGYLVIGAGNDNLYRRLCNVLGRSEWATDPRFLSNADRLRHRPVLAGLIGDVVAADTVVTWCARLDAAGVPNAPIHTTDQIVRHPQTEALEVIQPTPDGAMSLVGLPLSFDGTRPPLRRSPPSLGQDTDAVLGAIKAATE